MPKLKEAARLRALANECRDLARIISYRPDRDLLMDNAKRYDEAADRLDPPRHSPLSRPEADGGERR